MTPLSQRKATASAHSTPHSASSCVFFAKIYFTSLLQIFRLHRVVEHGGDRVGKDAVGVRVQGVERLRHGGDLHFAGGVHILIEDEAHFLFLHLLDLVAVADVALDKAGACVQLERRERVELALDVDRALGDARFVHVVLVKNAEIRRLEQIVPAAAREAELLARNGVDKAKAHAVKAVGTVNLDKLAERLVETGGKVLPVRVAHGGKGDEVLREAQLVAAVFGNERVVVDRPRGRAVHAGQLFHLALVARERRAHGLLKVGGLARVDRKNGGEAQLADDLDELRFAVGVAAVIGRDHNVNTSVMLHLIINYRGKKNDCQISVRARRSADKTYQQKNCISDFL